MKIRQWLGYNEDASQFALQPGELRILNNLQPRRPGMLLSRAGLKKRYGRYNNELIAGMYRRANTVGSQSDFLWMIRTLVEKELTIEEIDEGVYPFEFQWAIKRIQADQERIIDTFPVNPFGTDIYNFCVAEDRHGRLFLFYGHGVRPRLYRPDNIANSALPLGLDPPESQPSVTPTGSGYFLENVDVVSGGGTYNEPPELILSGGNPERPAKIKAIIESGAVVGVDIIDGGSNYKSPPQITVGKSDIGVGFRARGVYTSSAYTSEGFATGDVGAVSADILADNETYGTRNGTSGQQIIYLDGDGNTAYADADYDEDTRVYTARVPAHVNGTTNGDGAAAYLRFSPLPLGYALNTASLTSSITTINNRFQQYDRIERGRGNAANPTGFRDFLYGDYWEGTEYNVKSSKENRTYGGIQASGERFVRGYSGTISGRQADVYWPDYSKISVWYNTGTAGDNISQWSREDVPVITETNPDNETSVRYIDITLKPRSGAKEVASINGLSTTTNYTEQDKLPDATPPTVRIYLTDCPDSWLVDGNECFPTSLKESKGQRLPWYSASSGVPRPVVDIRRNEDGAPDDTSVSIQDPGSGWVENTTFAIRLYQANAYEQKVDYNTAVSEEFFPAAHSRTGNYVEFQFKTNAPDENTPHGPPHTLLEPAVLAVPGDGYKASDVARITLAKRDRGYEPPSPDNTPSTDVALLLTGSFVDQSTYGNTIVNTGVTIEPTGVVAGSNAFEFSEPYSKIAISHQPKLILDSQFSIEMWVKLSGNQQKDASLISTAGGGVGDGTWQIDFGDFNNIEFIGGTYGLIFSSTTSLQLNRWYHIAVTRDRTSDVTLWIDGIKDTVVSNPYQFGGYSSGLTIGRNRTDNRQFVGVIDEIRIVNGVNAYEDITQFTPPQSFGGGSGGVEVTASSSIQWQARTLQTFSGVSSGKISSIQILSQGFGYKVPPAILTRGGRGGYGLSVLPILKDGAITDVQIIDPGLNYTSDPELYTDSTPARLLPKMRPALRGTYRCAYRYADRTDQVIKSTTAYLGDSETTLILEDAEDVEADMILESEFLPHNARITSLKAGEVEINQPITKMVKGHLPQWVAYTGQSKVFNDQYATTVLERGGSLAGGEKVYSPDVDFMCEVTKSGNLILFERTLNPGNYIRDPFYEYVTERFATGTARSDCVDAVLEMKQDGQLVLTGTIDDGSGNLSSVVLWSTVATGLEETLELSNSGTFATYSITQSYPVIVRDLSKPVSYSDLSPIVDVECGPTEDRTHSSKLTWKLTGVTPPARADKVEFWRTSGDQSLVFYRVEAYGIPRDNSVEVIGEDTLTDEELFDPDRPHYAAMPVVLPNGAVNAYRFGKPRSDMAVAVAFQDRLWYGVSTSNKDINTLYYSEFDEFESTPDVNELPIQNNQKSTDSLTALVPFGSMLLAMQHNHTYALTYNSDPGLDASIQMLSHRGCLHQRCWDIHENILYAVDESGIYSMTRSGEVTDISLPLRDLFVTELLAFNKRETFFLQVDPRTHILRFFTILLSNPTETPSLAICYDIQAKTWWTETYPNGLTSSCTCRPSDIRRNTVLFGAADGNMYELEGDEDHNNHSLTDTFVDDGGSGYREAPTITVPNVIGATVQGVVSEGRLVDVIINGAGWNADQGINLATEQDGLPISDHANRNIQGVEYAPIPLDIGPPDPGGRQATAYANFSVTSIVRRYATISKGESFVRVDPLRVSVFEPDLQTWLQTESGIDLITEDDIPIRTQPPIVEAGMEAVGDFIPLNAYVSHVDRNNIYLVHPDGSPVSILGGEARTNTPGTTSVWLEEGGTRVLVKFYKASHSHIPFRMQTGFMQRLNEDVDRRAAGEVERSVTLLYNPTHGEKEVELLERFNGRDELIPNLMRRERGGPGSFVHRQDSASTVLNIDREASALGFATGVAKAKFASRATADLTGSDQYVQYEIHGRPYRSDPRDRLNFWNPDNTVRKPLPFVMHSLTVEGVVEDGR